jgi:hypothetical protein
MFKITGEIKVINDAVQVTDKFKKREFVLIDDSSQYPQFINFQLTQDRCSLLDAYQVGQRIEVDFNLRGREWTDKLGVVKYFNSLDAWRVAPEQQLSNTEIPSIPTNFLEESGDADILPF